jgi:hypothetical protein
MSRLEPCPSCARHVRLQESACPFCQQPLALSELPPRPLPRKRLGRAATFAFGASVVGATALVACQDEQEPEPDPPTVPVYGAPAAGTSSGPAPGEGGQAGQGGASSAEGGQSGAPPTNSGGTGGEAFAVYGSPPGGEGAI